MKSGAALRFARGEYHFRSPSKLHYYILIEGKRFETFHMPFVRGHSVRGLVWRNNEVIYNGDFPPRDKEPFVFDDSEEVDIDGSAPCLRMPVDPLTAGR